MTKEEFLALAGKRYDALQDLNELDNFYDYEKSTYRYGESSGERFLKVI